MMGNLNVRIGNLGITGADSRNFQANATPLETKSLNLFNFDKTNDYSVPLRFSGKDGEAVTVYMRPDQVDAMKMALAGASRNEMLTDTPSVSVTINGQTYTMSAREAQTQLSGKGILTAGS